MDKLCVISGKVIQCSLPPPSTQDNSQLQELDPNLTLSSQVSNVARRNHPANQRPSASGLSASEACALSLRLSPASSKSPEACSASRRFRPEAQLMSPISSGNRVSGEPSSGACGREQGACASGLPQTGQALPVTCEPLSMGNALGEECGAHSDLPAGEPCGEEKLTEADIPPTQVIAETVSTVPVTPVEQSPEHGTAAAVRFAALGNCGPSAQSSAGIGQDQGRPRECPPCEQSHDEPVHKNQCCLGGDPPVSAELGTDVPEAQLGVHCTGSMAYEGAVSVAGDGLVPNTTKTSLQEKMSFKAIAGEQTWGRPAGVELQTSAEVPMVTAEPAAACVSVAIDVPQQSSRYALNIMKGSLPPGVLVGNSVRPGSCDVSGIDADKVRTAMADLGNGATVATSASQALGRPAGGKDGALTKASEAQCTTGLPPEGGEGKTGAEDGQQKRTGKTIGLLKPDGLDERPAAESVLGGQGACPGNLADSGTPSSKGADVQPQITGAGSEGTGCKEQLATETPPEAGSGVVNGSSMAVGAQSPKGSNQQQQVGWTGMVRPVSSEEQLAADTLPEIDAGDNGGCPSGPCHADPERLPAGAAIPVLPDSQKDNGFMEIDAADGGDNPSPTCGTDTGHRQAVAPEQVQGPLLCKGPAQDNPSDRVMGTRVVDVTGGWEIAEKGSHSPRRVGDLERQHNRSNGSDPLPSIDRQPAADILQDGGAGVGAGGDPIVHPGANPGMERDDATGLTLPSDKQPAGDMVPKGQNRDEECRLAAPATGDRSGMGQEPDLGEAAGSALHSLEQGLLTSEAAHSNGEIGRTANDTGGKFPDFGCGVDPQRQQQQQPKSGSAGLQDSRGKLKELKAWPQEEAASKAALQQGGQTHQAVSGSALGLGFSSEAKSHQEQRQPGGGTGVTTAMTEDGRITRSQVDVAAQEAYAFDDALFTADGDAHLVLACTVISSELDALVEVADSELSVDEAVRGRWQGLLWLLRKLQGCELGFAGTDCEGFLQPEHVHPLETGDGPCSLDVEEYLRTDTEAEALLHVPSGGTQGWDWLSQCTIDSGWRMLENAKEISRHLSASQQAGTLTQHNRSQRAVPLSGALSHRKENNGVPDKARSSRSLEPVEVGETSREGEGSLQVAHLEEAPAPSAACGFDGERIKPRMGNSRSPRCNRSGMDCASGDDGSRDSQTEQPENAGKSPGSDPAPRRLENAFVEAAGNAAGPEDVVTAPATNKDSLIAGEASTRGDRHGKSVCGAEHIHGIDSGSRDAEGLIHVNDGITKPHGNTEAAESTRLQADHRDVQHPHAVTEGDRPGGNERCLAGPSVRQACESVHGGSERDALRGEVPKARGEITDLAGHVPPAGNSPLPVLILGPSSLQQRLQRKSPQLARCKADVVLAACAEQGKGCTVPEAPASTADGSGCEDSELVPCTLADRQRWQQRGWWCADAGGGHGRGELSPPLPGTPDADSPAELEAAAVASPPMFSQGLSVGAGAACASPAPLRLQLDSQALSPEGRPRCTPDDTGCVAGGCGDHGEAVPDSLPPSPLAGLPEGCTGRHLLLTPPEAERGRDAEHACGAYVQGTDGNTTDGGAAVAEPVVTPCPQDETDNMQAPTVVNRGEGHSPSDSDPLASLVPATAGIPAALADRTASMRSVPADGSRAAAPAEASLLPTCTPGFDAVFCVPAPGAGRGQAAAGGAPGPACKAPATGDGQRLDLASCRWLGLGTGLRGRRAVRGGLTGNAISARVAAAVSKCASVKAKAVRMTPAQEPHPTETSTPSQTARTAEVIVMAPAMP
eukprot:CAMPEP_0177596382 /NCGR_PEP_ID=MMETSP0419_2-20121207/11022_1 /TAXON_ID=582737 /ORGANISM="Tetraselmis sp., Strain GSL018" /LENGTH=1785 /DNA_ID=CAMNT_0019088229 /DNA_START=92 /DNA_END=5450 /DNA_ORIENTATION=-